MGTTLSNKANMRAPVSFILLTVAVANADPEAYTIGQVALGLPLANAYATGHPHNVGVVTGVGYSGYGGVYYGKREADAYTLGQVAHGLPVANAYATGQVAYGGARGVITGVDYGYGAVSGYGAIGNRG